MVYMVFAFSRLFRLGLNFSLYFFFFNTTMHSVINLRADMVELQLCRRLGPELDSMLSL